MRRPQCRNYFQVLELAINLKQRFLSKGRSLDREWFQTLLAVPLFFLIILLIPLIYVSPEES